MKLKLKPSSRIKRRYILFNTNSKEEIEKIIADYLGILGWAKSSPLFIKTVSSSLILAIDRKGLNDVRAAFEIADTNIKILRVSGTLKGLDYSNRLK